MDAGKGRPFGYTIRVHENGGGFDADEFRGGGETMSSTDEMSTPQCSLSRTSEVTLSFEGEVYVFPAVTREKVQAVLVLLGGRETPTSIPSSEFLIQLSDKGVDDVSSQPMDDFSSQPLDDCSSQPMDDFSSQPMDTFSSHPLDNFSSHPVDDFSSQPMVSRRIASLERFREKKKGRRFDKRISYTCRKEVAQRMHRRNGQFASVQNTCKTSDDNWDLNNTTHPDSGLRKCQNCGVGETSTPLMRRGPAGPRTLCNACGLMWSNKGTLREHTKGGSHTLEQNEPLPATELNSYCNQDEELAGHGTPEHTTHPSEFRNPLVRTEQETLDELPNVSGTFPANSDEQVAVDSHIVGIDLTRDG